MVTRSIIFFMTLLLARTSLSMEAPDHILAQGKTIPVYNDDNKRREYFATFVCNEDLKWRYDSAIVSYNKDTGELCDNSGNDALHFIRSTWQELYNAADKACKTKPYLRKESSKINIGQSTTYRALPPLAKAWERYAESIQNYNGNRSRCLLCKEELRWSSFRLHFQGVHELTCPCGFSYKSWKNFKKHKKQCTGQPSKKIIKKTWCSRRKKTKSQDDFQVSNKNVISTPVTYTAKSHESPARTMSNGLEQAIAEEYYSDILLQFSECLARNQSLQRKS